MKIFIFACCIVFGYHSIFSQETKRTKESIVGLNISSNPDNKNPYNFIELYWQYSDRLENKVMIPFMEYRIAYNLQNRDPDGSVIILIGLKNELLSNRDKLILFASDFAVGYATGINGGDKADSEFGGFIATYGLNCAYKNIVIRFAGNFYSDYPFKGLLTIGLAYAF